MQIYADTSFLVAWLYPGHKHHATTRAFGAAKVQDDWFTSQWSRFETLNSLRQQCREPGGPKPPMAEALRRLFKHWHRAGPFVEWDADWEAADRECNRISATFATSAQMRTADAIHLGMIEELQPDLFVTRDKAQHALALSLRYPAQLLP